MNDDPAAIETALTSASEAHDLPTYYRALVKPLLRMDEAGWPTCCGGNCDPCTDQLVRVARAVKTLLGT